MPSSPKFSSSSNHSTKMRMSTIFVVSCLAVIGISGLVFGLTSYNILQPYVNLGLPCQNPNTTSPGLLTLTGPSSGSKPADAKHVRYGGGEGHKLIGFVGIQTGFGSIGRRKALRKSWMPSNQADLRRLEESTGLALRFVIGRTSDEGKMSELKQEIATYNDFLLLDIEETYDNLPHKTIAYMRAAFALFDAKFYVKIDDDIYMRPDRLSILLNQERSHPYTYIGCMTKGKFYNNPKHKWYEPLSYMLGGEYFMYAYGSIYALSADVVAIVASLKNDSLRLFRNEDVSVGSWMLALNVSHEDNRALCQLECSPTSIAVWNEYKCTGVCDPEINLVKLHENEICSKDPSKLPEN